MLGSSAGAVGGVRDTAVGQEVREERNGREGWEGLGGSEECDKWIC